MRLDEARGLLARDLNDKSDRACVIGVCASINKLIRDACERSAQADSRSIRTLERRIAFARQQGWIDQDLFTDLDTIRKIRNRFAHEVDAHTLDDEAVERAINAFRIPRRLYYDWGEVAAAETSNGVVLYSGSRPSEAVGSLRIGGLLFRMALAAILALLASELGLVLELDDGSTLSFEVTDQLRKPD